MSSAFTAKTFEHHLFVYYRKLFTDLIGDSYVVIILAVKIYYAVTLNTSEMVMGIHIRIITLGLSIAFNYICNTNF